MEATAAYVLFFSLAQDSPNFWQARTIPLPLLNSSPVLLLVLALASSYVWAGLVLAPAVQQAALARISWLDFSAWAMAPQVAQRPRRVVATPEAVKAAQRPRRVVATPKAVKAAQRPTRVVATPKAAKAAKAAQRPTRVVATPKAAKAAKARSKTPEKPVRSAPLRMTRNYQDLSACFRAPKVPQTTRGSSVTLLAHPSPSTIFTQGIRC